ncbi:LemA family protein [Patescibacteria group bacterium]|nr:LemA family protein [Patescibacteria group bacterium]
MKKVLIGLVIVVGLMGLYAFGTYNTFVSKNEVVDNSWAQVEAQYQRRFDLIPNLVESVKGIMTQEKEVFGAIAEARTKYAGASSADTKVGAAGELESALGRLLVIMENYPELKSSENVTILMAQLEGAENRITVERKRYNDSAADYNILAKRVPSKWVGSMFGFEERNYFEAQAGAESAPQVKF